MEDYNVRQATKEDSPLLRKLADKCKPLDVHTPYTYWLISNFFGKGCFIIQTEQEIIWYITTVIADNRLFIWQIGIIKQFRGKKISEILINKVIEYARAKNIKEILVTIDPNNINSLQSFSKYCDKNNFEFTKIDELILADFIEENFYENENIYLIKLN